MNSNKIDGKAELEKSLAKYPNQSSMLRLVIEFQNRDALLEALCQKVFGAEPAYCDETPMRANVDVINDFSRLQAANRDLTQSNVKLAGDLLELQSKIDTLKNHPAYAKTFDETETIEENPKCGCRACNPKAWWMIACGICGNKRCPHGTNHEHACTNSNEPDQEGSVYK